MTGTAIVMRQRASVSHVSRYELLRKAIDGLEDVSNKASAMTFRGVRASLDWLEEREPNAQPTATGQASPVVSSPVSGPLNTDEPLDDAGEESFPASDPTGWAGLPDP